MMNGRCLTRILFLTLFVFGLSGTSAVAADGPRFSMKPAVSDPAVPGSAAYFILDAQPGQTIQRSVLVVNTGATAGAVRLFSVDATTGQNSGIVYRAETDPRDDVGAWIGLNAQNVTLNPGESKEIPFTIAVPASPRPGQHVGGIVAEDTTLTSGSSGGASVNIKTQTIVAVQLSLPGQTVEKIDVTAVSGGGEAGRQLLLLGLRNGGTTMVAPTGTLVVTNAKGDELQNLPLKLDKILPDTTIQYPVAVQTKALAAGDYQANIMLKYGQSGETQYQMPFVITPAQIAQVFPPTQQAASQTTSQLTAATLAPPSSTSGNGSGSVATALQTAPVAPLLLLLGGIGGSVIVIAVVGGAVMLGRRKRS